MTTGGLAKTRIETLCDGVFAIAMTLMIFNIKVPDLAGDAPSDALVSELFSLWPQFVVYAISFVMLGVYWVGHHNQYHYIRRVDRVLLWINIVFLLCVGLIPFSTALLGRYPGRQPAVIVYAGTLMLVGTMLLIHWRYAVSHRRLVHPDIEDEVVERATRRIAAGLVILATAVLLSFVSTVASIGLFASIPVLYVLPGQIDRHW
jgi:uncharacterized membrane protein